MSDGFKGRVLVLGGRGMLGRAVAVSARHADYQTWVTGSEHDISNLRTMRILEDTIHPHLVVNCAGLIPTRMGSHTSSDMVRVNAYGPWIVRDAFPNSRIIHVSTDCVFSGFRMGARSVLDIPDPVELYGRTKAMGEAGATMVVRTSFIGYGHGLLQWFVNLRAGETVPGWSRAYWSGGTVYDVADALVDMFRFKYRDGVHHLAAPTISKYELLVELRKLFDKDITIIDNPEPVVYRGLKPTIELNRNLAALLHHVPAEVAS